MKIVSYNNALVYNWTPRCDDNRNNCNSNCNNNNSDNNSNNSNTT